jgi:uncharacterized protein
MDEEQPPYLAPTIAYVKDQLAQAEGGHDWYHVERVWRLARRLAAAEDTDLSVVDLGALLHDVADAKFHHGDESIGPRKARQFMERLALGPGISDHVVKIIEQVSFRKSGVHTEPFSRELAVVQDADRLDAMGAIGIARAFNFGGHKGRPLHVPPEEHWEKPPAATVQHFYDKLLLLKEGMHTELGQALAEERHRFMQTFLAQFYAEWHGRR